MRLPPFTTRRLMVLVVVAALSLNLGLVLHRRHVRLSGLAAKYGQEAQDYRLSAWRGFAQNHYNRDMGRIDIADRYRRGAESLQRLADHYEQLERKYRRAARFLWLPVPPDPPAPE